MVVGAIRPSDTIQGRAIRALMAAAGPSEHSIMRQLARGMCHVPNPGTVAHTPAAKPPHKRDGWIHYAYTLGGCASLPASI
mmetsp:Transcript_22520/g.49218  ORF Transcript_22520/g.49218 Transcript_22520/m.49218 type:complete len:81 (+) Transcript_22520:2761-3003(+)